MAKNNLTDLSTTNDSNTDIGGANIAENCSPGGINNAIRNMAGLLARAFNEADPTTTITAIKSANYIVAADSRQNYGRDHEPHDDPAQQHDQHHDHHARRVGQPDRSGDAGAQRTTHGDGRDADWRYNHLQRHGPGPRPEAQQWQHLTLSGSPRSPAKPQYSVADTGRVR